MPKLTDLEIESLEQDLMDIWEIIETCDNKEELKILCQRKQAILAELWKYMPLFWKQWSCPLDGKD